MIPIHRRAFASRVLVTAGSAWLAGRSSAQGQAAAPAVLRSEGDRPAVRDGVASGDVGSDGMGVVWARTDRPSRLVVEWATTDSFEGARRVVGPAALPETGFAAKAVLLDLPPGQTIVYRASFVDLSNPKARSYPALGRFRTPSREPADVRFCWGGDVAGQGFGIDPSRGGCGSSTRSGTPGPTSSSTPATTSTPTTRSSPRSSSTTGPCGGTS